MRTARNSIDEYITLMNDWLALGFSGIDAMVKAECVLQCPVTFQNGSQANIVATINGQGK